MQLRCSTTDEIIELSKKSMAEGGEAKIYSTNKVGFLAKIYNSPSQSKSSKLQVMLDNPPRGPIYSKNHISIVWPQDILLDDTDNFKGYLMPEVKNGHTLINVYSPRRRKTIFPDFSWRDLHITALNLARLIKILHDKNYVIGDLKPTNILVNRQKLVSIIDTDSFQVIDPNTGKLYLGTVASSEHTAPEMLGEDLQVVCRSELQDRFGLAILIWLLLFGYHPFRGKQEDSSQSKIDQWISHGYWMYGNDNQVRQYNWAIPLETLYSKLQLYFRRCFDDGHQDPAARPSAAEWVNALSKAVDNLVQCSLVPEHYYTQTLNQCYWCRRKEILKYDIFDSSKMPTQQKKVNLSLPKTQINKNRLLPEIEVDDELYKKKL